MRSFILNEIKLILRRLSFKFDFGRFRELGMIGIVFLSFLHWYYICMVLECI